MNPLRNLSAFVHRTWHVIVLSVVGVVMVAAGLVYHHNRGRFLAVPTSDGYPPYVIDTDTGQYCDPWPQSLHPKRTVFPYCVDLAKNWR